MRNLGTILILCFLPIYLFSQEDYVRPFGDYAPWNIEVSYLEEHPNSDYYAQLLWENATENVPGLFKISIDQYTYPVYEITEGLAEYKVISSNPTWGNLHDKKIPFDSHWLPATGTDGQIIILDPASGREWDLWQVNFENDTVFISNGNLVQAGISPGDGSNPGNYWIKENGFSSSRGCGIQYLAMLVRPAEIAEGVIRHALSMPIRNPDGNEFVYPATKLEHPYGQVGIPEGMRFALNISDEEIEEWLLTVSPHIRNTARIIVVALRDYGWFVTDTSGDAHLQFEHRYSAPEWDELGMEDVTIDWRRYPRDLFWGLFDLERIYALSDNYEGITLNLQEQEQKNSLTVFPNPVVDGKLKIQLKKETVQKIELLNTLGEKVQVFTSFDSSADGIVLTLADLPVGIYYLSVMGKEHSITKIILK